MAFATMKLLICSGRRERRRVMKKHSYGNLTPKQATGVAGHMTRSWLITRMTAPVLICLCAFLLSACGVKDEESAQVYRDKAALLKEQALADWVRTELGNSPAENAGNAVFISVCDTSERARVFSGTGTTVDEAWENASQKAEKQAGTGTLKPVWVKADVVYLSETIRTQELYTDLKNSRQGFFRYGAALDPEWENAFLEAELNGTGSYDYESGAIDLSYLNHYLTETGREEISSLPNEYTVFQCIGWICDEENSVYQLSASGPEYGGREVDIVDDSCAKDMILNASGFLADQVKEDGSFVYGIYPRFGNGVDGYNMIRHASSIWSLICRYRMEEDAELGETIGLAIDYMLGNIIYDDNGNAYLYEETNDEIRLGGCGMAVVALTEYMDAFDSDKYTDVCRALGNGILSLLDRKTGEYYHVLNGDFSRKEAFRTIYYDGEATFALCRLYGLTKEAEWLYAARDAVDHFIRADYTQYKDHWVAYAMNEITKYIKNDADYYVFALKNAQVNLEEISSQDTTYHTYLELLMATFELYDRMSESGAKVEGFDLAMLLKTIYARADYMRTGYFYPEYAMYMQNPGQILNTFMVRHDGYRIRIDDVQHNIGGYYLYYTNYERLVKYGMLEYADV